MHFDLYNTSINVKTGITDIDADKFAPFSHDAESRVTRVPEPATASSLLLGLLLIGFAHRRFQRV
jgi:hypothetical protein